VQGAGWYATRLLLASGVNGPVLQLGDGVTASYNILLMDFEVDGNSGGQTAGNGVSVLAHRCRLVRLLIRNCRDHGIGTGSYVENVILVCQIRENLGHGIRMAGTDSHILACIIHQNTGDGINAAGAGGVLIEDCHIWGNANGVVFTGGNRCAVVGCWIENNNQHGILLGHVATPTERIVILGNVIWNNGQAAANTYSGIRAQDQGLVDGVIIGNAIDGPQHMFAIDLYGGDRNTILGNTLGAGGSGAFRWAGNAASVLRGNTGYATETQGQATFSGDGATTQFTIPHGLAQAPNAWAVTPESADAAGDYYVTADATNLYVNYLAAPPAGAGNVVLRWRAWV